MYLLTVGNESEKQVRETCKDLFLHKSIQRKNLFMRKSLFLHKRV